MKAWRGFRGDTWRTGIDVAGFIQENYQPYEGDEHFLEKATERTAALWEKVCDLRKKELENGGVLDIDVTKVSSLLTYAPGYIDRANEHIYGLQTDAPLKRGVNPFGGIRMARQACEAYGYTLSDQVEEHFAYKTTHNEGVFRVYSDEMKRLRSAGVLTGLPDAYGRGRIIGDYRRVALYGVDFLIEEKKRDKRALEAQPMLSDTIQLIEEVHRQIDFLGKLKTMASAYGDDISLPAETGREAIQWLYYGYLGAIKEQNGAAMSLGRVGTFLDIYLERDIKEGTLDELNAQALIDDFVIKLRLARQLRTPEYNTLFAGDPLWITESIGGMGCDGRTLVTKTAYRFLHTLETLGPAPEPNMTVLWSEHLPAPFKHYVAKMSVRTDAIQYENDDLMRPIYGDDYAIACCVSAMRVGKEMQFFGARCNLAKVLLLALNDGRDEMTGEQIALETISTDRETKCADGGTARHKTFAEGSPLDFEKVTKYLDAQMAWICEKYVNTMNIIHYMHDKYAYEKTQMALHDTQVHRYMAFGIAGLSVVADALSAIKYAKVYPVIDHRGIISDFHIEGDFPKYGNDDDRVDQIAVWLTEVFTAHLKKHPTYRGAEHTLSVLTITSNVVYGAKTGSTPDGRRSGEAFAPGANPMHGRESRGALAALNSVAKLPFRHCRDGISYTFSVSPNTLGQDEQTQSTLLVQLMGGFFSQNAHHLNVNVISREKLMDAMAHPERYPNLTIRVSGYAVNFHQLSQNQQLEVINRTYHERL